MKFIKIFILLFANVLAVQSHSVKRDLKNDKTYAYIPIIPDISEQMIENNLNNGGIINYKKIEIETNEMVNNNNKIKFMKASTNQPFEFEFSCKSSKSNCDVYKKYIKQAANYIANTFEIYNTIKAMVTITSFCDSNFSNCENTSGITYPPSYIEFIDENNEKILYPQALAKQINNNQYSDYDFHLCFNTDLELVNDELILFAAHEILHGLGFYSHILPISCLNSRLKKVSNPFPNDIVIPPFNIADYKNSHVIDKWKPFSLFDRRIVATSKSKEYLYKKLEKFKKNEINFTFVRNGTVEDQITFINKFTEYLKKDKEAYNIGLEIYKLFTTANAVSFRTNDGTLVKLQTFNGVFNFASSISHNKIEVCNDLQCRTKFDDYDQNYIMNYKTYISSVNNYIQKFKNISKHDLIGNDIVKIMCAIGWTEKTNNSKVAIAITKKTTTTTKKTTTKKTTTKKTATTTKKTSTKKTTTSTKKTSTKKTTATTKKTTTKKNTTTKKKTTK